MLQTVVAFQSFHRTSSQRQNDACRGLVLSGRMKREMKNYKGGFIPEKSLSTTHRQQNSNVHRRSKLKTMSHLRVSHLQAHEQKGMTLAVTEINGRRVRENQCQRWLKISKFEAKSIWRYSAVKAQDAKST